MSENKISQIFKNLEYGPAPETPNIAYQWLDEHKRKFGHFVNGKWVHPENRKEASSKSPATGRYCGLYSYIKWMPKQILFQDYYENSGPTFVCFSIITCERK